MLHQAQPGFSSTRASSKVATIAPSLYYSTTAVESWRGSNSSTLVRPDLRPTPRLQQSLIVGMILEINDIISCLLTKSSESTYVNSRARYSCMERQHIKHEWNRVYHHVPHPRYSTTQSLAGNRPKTTLFERQDIGRLYVSIVQAFIPCLWQYLFRRCPPFPLRQDQSRKWVLYWPKLSPRVLAWHARGAKKLPQTSSKSRTL